MVTAAEIDAIIRVRLEGENQLRQAQSTVAGFEASVKHVGSSAGSLDAIPTKFGQIGSEAKEAAASLDHIPASITKVNAAAEQTGSSVSKLSSAFEKAATSAVGFATAQIGIASAQAAISKAFDLTIASAVGFEQALANVQAATGATKEQMAAMAAEAKRIGADTSVGAGEAVQAMGELTKAGVAVEDVIGGVGRTVVQMSEATGSSVSNMATLLSDAMNVFKIGAGGAGDAANILVKAAGASSISIDDMAQSLAQGGLVAKSAGLSIQDFATAIGIMGNQGLKASDAGTSLKSMIAGLTPATKEAKGAFEQLGIQVFDSSGKFKAFPDILANLSQAFSGLTEQQRAVTAELIFGSDGIRAFNALAPSMSSGLADASQQWQNFGTAAAAAPSILEQSAIRMSTLSGQIELLKGDLESAGLAIGQKVIPMIVTALNALKTALQSAPVQTWAAGMQTLGEAVMGLPAPIKVATAALVAMGVALALISATPVIAIIGGIVIAVGLLAGKLRELVKEADGFDAAAQKMQAWAAGTTEATQTITTQIEAMKSAGASNAQVVEMMRQKHEALNATLAAQPNLWRENRTEFDALSGGLRSLENEVQQFGVSLAMTGDGASVVVGKVRELPPQIKNVAAAATEADAAMAIWARALGKVGEEATKIKDPLKEAVQALHELTSTPTQVSQNLAADLKEITAAQEALTLATKLSGNQKQFWIDKAKEMVSQADLEKGALEKANKAIGDYEKGLIGGEKATKDLTEATKGSKDIKEQVVKTEDAYAKALDASATAQLGLGKSIDSLKGAVQEMVGGFLIAMGKIPPAADQMSNSVLAAWVKLDTKGAESGQNLGAAYALGILQKRADAETAAGELNGAATQALQSTGLARSAGVNLGGSFAQGIRDQVGTARDAAAFLSAAAIGSLNSAMQAGSPSKKGIESGRWLGEGFAIGIRQSVTDYVEPAIDDLMAAWDGVNLDKKASIIAQFEQFDGAMGALADHALDVVTEFAGFSAAMDGLKVETGDATAGFAEFNTAMDHLAGRLSQAEQEEFAAFNAAMAGLKSETADAGQELETFATIATGMGAALLRVNLDPFTVQLRDFEAETKRLTVAKTELQLRLANTQPYTAEAAAIEDQIKILDAWANKVGLQTTLLKAQQEAIEASKTALDGFNAAVEKQAATKLLQAQTGKSGLATGQALGAALQGGPKEGEAFFAELDKLMETLTQKAGPAGTLFGQHLMAAAVAALQERTPEAVDTFLTMLGQIDARLPENARLSAETWVTAYGAALTSADALTRFGQAGAALMTALDTAITTGGQANIATLATQFVAYQQQLQRLPEFVRGTLAPDLAAAWQAVMNAPGDPAAIAALEAAVARAGQALAVFPADIEQQVPHVQAAARRLFEGVETGVIGVKEAQERYRAIVQLFGKDLDEQNPIVRRAAEQLAVAVESGSLDAETALKRLQLITRVVPQDFEHMAANVRAAAAAMADGVVAGTTTTAQAVDAMSQSLKQADADAQEIQDNFKRRLDEIELYRQKYAAEAQRQQQQSPASGGGGDDNGNVRSELGASRPPVEFPYIGAPLPGQTSATGIPAGTYPRGRPGIPSGGGPIIVTLSPESVVAVAQAVAAGPAPVVTIGSDAVGAAALRYTDQVYGRQT